MTATPFRPGINAATWAVTSIVTIAIALINTDAVFTPYGVVPMGNDAFYHAARILDAAVGERGFYQFDTAIHVPEGSWVTWSWGYDYLLSRLVIVQQFLFPSSDPMSFLVYVPVIWIPVNVFLLLSITREIGLPAMFRPLAVIGFALLPTTQTQHGIGQMDHHFMELGFVLLVTLSLLRWLNDPTSRHRALALGAALGVAHAFHHALFILQLPVLLTVGLLWLKGRPVARRATDVVACSGLLSTLLVALPSAPVLDMQFNMTSLSWFHVYVSGCVAVVLLALGRLDRSWRNAAILAVVSLIALLPMLDQVVRGGEFLSGQLLMLDKILEMKSPFAMIVGDFGLGPTLGLYGALVLLIPLLMAYAAWQLFADTTPARSGYFVFALIGLGLMLAQYRLNYFGSAFMLITPWLVAEQLQQRRRWKHELVLGVSVIALLLVFRPALTGSLFNRFPPAGNVLYATVQPLMPALSEACDEQPGIVLAHPQFGHYITYHTQCSVIANNFLISDQHFMKVGEVNQLFTVPASVLAGDGGLIRYVLAMAADTHEMVDGVAVMKPLDTIAERNPALLRDLLFADEPTADVTELQRVQVETPDGPVPVAAVFRFDKAR
ncbi:MAG: hypothetical protein AAGA44_06645 [Pseudomonadota bacterium]